ncbi:MAG TPA: hypothetical protein VKE94_01915, partial [Gemmataceae bacterium]|nr:hypothetical protein [Gemmataceae bacterium]
MKRLIILALGFLPSLAWGGDFAAEKLDNWPHWRGPLANGVAPKADPPVFWDAKTNIKWKTPLQGKGSATPIVWEDQVFVITAINTERVADPK